MDIHHFTQLMASSELPCGREQKAIYITRGRYTVFMIRLKNEKYSTVIDEF